jgi:hypothetical protein
MYCGNNKFAPGLMDGTVRLGNRYDCFRRGVGIGLNLPVDPSFRRQYEPIDKERVYCGKKTRRPQGYTRTGNLPQCQAKGVGVGKRLKAMGRRAFAFPGVEKYGNPWGKILFTYIASSILWFLYLYYTKPCFVMKEDQKAVDMKKLRNVFLWGLGILFISYYIVLNFII